MPYERRKQLSRRMWNEKPEQSSRKRETNLTVTQEWHGTHMMRLSSSHRSMVQQCRIRTEHGCCCYADVADDDDDNDDDADDDNDDDDDDEDDDDDDVDDENDDDDDDDTNFLVSCRVY